MPKTAKKTAPKDEVVQDTPVTDEAAQNDTPTTDEVAPIKGTDAESGVDSNDVSAPEPVAEANKPYEIEEMKHLSNSTARAKIMKKVLADQPKVLMMIPLGLGEVDTDGEAGYEYATINDYHLRVKKNRMALMPQQVAQMFAEKYNIELNVGSGLKSKAATAKELN